MVTLERIFWPNNEFVDDLIASWSAAHETSARSNIEGCVYRTKGRKYHLVVTENFPVKKEASFGLCKDVVRATTTV